MVVIFCVLEKGKLVLLIIYYFHNKYILYFRFSLLLTASQQESLSLSSSVFKQFNRFFFLHDVDKQFLTIQDIYEQLNQLLSKLIK